MNLNQQDSWGQRVELARRAHLPTAEVLPGGESHLAVKELEENIPELEGILPQHDESSGAVSTNLLMVSTTETVYPPFFIGEAAVAGHNNTTETASGLTEAGKFASLFLSSFFFHLLITTSTIL